MEVLVQLKTCEGCGCLWYRAQNQVSVYCKGCETKLRQFSTAGMRKKPRKGFWAVAEVIGGAL